MEGQDSIPIGEASFSFSNLPGDHESPFCFVIFSPKMRSAMKKILPKSEASKDAFFLVNEEKFSTNVIYFFDFGLPKSKNFDCQCTLSKFFPLKCKTQYFFIICKEQMSEILLRKLRGDE